MVSSLLISIIGTALMVQGRLAFFTGFGSGSSTDSVYDYLGVNSMVPFYTAMFKEMNNFDRAGGQGGIGLGTGLLNKDGSVTYPTPAPVSSGSVAGGYTGRSMNNNYGMRNNGMMMGGYGGGSMYDMDLSGGFRRRRR